MKWYIKRMFLEGKYWYMLMCKAENSVILIDEKTISEVREHTWNHFPYWEEYHYSKAYVNEWKDDMRIIYLNMEKIKSKFINEGKFNKLNEYLADVLDIRVGQTMSDYMVRESRRQQISEIVGRPYSEIMEMFARDIETIF